MISCTIIASAGSISSRHATTSPVMLRVLIRCQPYSAAPLARPSSARCWAARATLSAFTSDSAVSNSPSIPAYIRPAALERSRSDPLTNAIPTPSLLSRSIAAARSVRLRHSRDSP